DLDVDTRRQIEFHQLVNRLVGRIDDVHQPQVCANFELIARCFVHVRRTQDVVALDLRRQRHGALHNGAGALRRLDDFERRLIDQLVIERFETNADSLVLHRFTFRKTARKALGSSLPLSLRKATGRPRALRADLQFRRKVGLYFSPSLIRLPWPPRRRPRCGRLRGSQSASPLPSQSAQSAAPSSQCCPPASPSRCPPAIQCSPSRRWCGNKTAADTPEKTACAGHPLPSTARTPHT